MSRSVELTPEQIGRIGANLQAVKNAAFRHLTDEAHRLAVEYATTGRPFNSPAPYLYKRTGSLAASIKKTPYVQLAPGADGEQRIFSNDARARVHELGATFFGSPWLTFRLYANASESTPSGPWVRTHQVTIPARPFMGPAAEQATARWGEFVDEAMRTILGGSP